MGIKVTLRQKNINKGRKSLYLDFYPAIINTKTGKPTRREFLGLYIYIDKKDIKKQIEKKPTESLKFQYKELKPLNEIQKRHNSETLKLAEAIRQKKDNLLNKPEIYSEYEKEQLKVKNLGEQSFIEYFKKLTDKKYDSNYSNWLSTYKFLCIYTKGELKFKDLNEMFLEDFKEYLLSAKSLKGK